MLSPLSVLVGARLNLVETCLEISDLHDDLSFASRRVSARPGLASIHGVHKLALALDQAPETILQRFVEAAVELCGADSVGISVEKAEGDEQAFYEWVATAGAYANFLHVMLPRFPSACGICIRRNQPQLFRIANPLFESLNVEAPEVIDGILLPLRMEGLRGTIWIVAHGRCEAFDRNDVNMMEMLADLAAKGLRQQQRSKALLEDAHAAGAAAMAKNLAKQIGAPLKTVNSVLYLTEKSHGSVEAKLLAQEVKAHLKELSLLVKKCLKEPAEALP